MKNKLRILIPIILVCLVIVFIVVRTFYPSEERTIAYIQERLYIVYGQNFECVQSLGKVDGKKSVYVFKPNDERGICFEVRYWIGAMDTPWGEQWLVQTRHVVDEFPEAVVDYVVSQSPYSRYDITDVPLDEVVANILSLETSAENLLTEYGANRIIPHMDITIVYNSKEYEMIFGNNESAIWNDIVDTVFEDDNTSNHQ